MAKFVGFETRRLQTTSTEISVTVGGSGPPLLLLHGHPQTYMQWHAVAPVLAEQFTVVCPDLRGCGASGKPEPSPDHMNYSKRALAVDQIETMQQLGFDRFAIAGHDRGGRVAYRLALDAPDRVSRVAILDIIPTIDSFDMLSRVSVPMFQWYFLAQPAPFPERLLGHDPDYYIDFTLKRLGMEGFEFDPEAQEAYRAAFRDPDTIRGACEDYRAAPTVDYDHDAADRAAGHRISAPLLILWGAGYPRPWDFLAAWRPWAEDLQGEGLNCGHWLTEERPQETAAALAAFFRDGS